MIRTAYHMPNDEREMDRLDFHHHMVVLANEDKLYTAPIDKDKTHRILDIGTGTGICTFLPRFLQILY